MLAVDFFLKTKCQVGGRVGSRLTCIENLFHAGTLKQHALIIRQGAAQAILLIHSGLSVQNWF